MSAYRKRIEITSGKKFVNIMSPRSFYENKNCQAIAILNKEKSDNFVLTFFCGYSAPIFYFCYSGIIIFFKLKFRNLDQR
jgi:succinate-acetate transporter protein